MAWEELLRQHDRREDELSPSAASETRDRGSLIRQAAEIFGQTGEESAGPAESGEPEVCVCYPDGYERRSPLQPYRTPEDYMRKRIRKAVAIAVAACFVILVVVALMRIGFLRF